VRRVLLSLFAVVLLTIEMLDLALGRGGLSGRVGPVRVELAQADYGREWTNRTSGQHRQMTESNPEPIRERHH